MQLSEVITKDPSHVVGVSELSAFSGSSLKYMIQIYNTKTKQQTQRDLIQLFCISWSM